MLYDPIGGNTGVLMNTSNVANATNLWNGMPNGNVFNFNIPLACLSFTNSASYFPLFASDLEIEFVVANANDIFANIAGTSNFAFSLSNLELLYTTIKLENAPFKNLISMQQFDNGMLEIKTDMWQYTTSSIPNGTGVGRSDHQYSISARSLKRLLFSTSPVNSAERNFAGVNANISNFQLMIGANQGYPQLPMRLTPSETYTMNQKSLGSLYNTKNSSCIHPYAFAKNVGGGGGSVLYSPYTAQASTIARAIEINTNFTTALVGDFQGISNKWNLLLDLESIDSGKPSLFNGVNTRGVGSSYIRLTHDAPVGVQCMVHMWSNVDAVIKIDINNMQTYVEY